MTRDGVLVDTSVLIDFLKDTRPNADAVTALIHAKQLHTTGIIMAELLQGAKNTREESYVSELLDGISPIEITAALWIKAGKLSCSLRRNGITLPLSDIAIAVTAMEYNLSVFTLDGHFKNIPGVKIFTPR